MLIRLGQSPSRILAAAVHWYRPDKRDFGDFLSWRRNDQFKRLMVEHAAKIHALDLDLVEASLLNAALIIATGELDHFDSFGLDFDRGCGIA